MKRQKAQAEKDRSNLEVENKKLTEDLKTATSALAETKRQNNEGNIACGLKFLPVDNIVTIGKIVGC